jgi:hypothetical protein
LQEIKITDKSARKFTRGINQLGMQALENLASRSAGSNWWKDLLTLWRPCGLPAGSDGLRLAIRNGYMNFYRRGQSVARVKFTAECRPILYVHIKYVHSKAVRDATLRSEYVRLETDQLIRGGGAAPLPYEGIATLRQWVQAVDADYSGPEKEFIDELIGLPENDCVLDLEMGLPAWSDKSTAPRIDLVSLNRLNGALTVFFGEVKRFTDGRLRCRGPLVVDQAPEVLKQLSDYRHYLDKPEHRDIVGREYINAARDMRRLRSMADALGEVHPLGETILEAANSESLSVARLAHLIVFNDGEGNQKAWEEHRAKLETEADRAPMTVITAPEPIRFGDLFD